MQRSAGPPQPTTRRPRPDRTMAGRRLWKPVQMVLSVRPAKRSWTAKSVDAPVDFSRNAGRADRRKGGHRCRERSIVHPEGENVSNKSLTIILPIHNGERRLRGCVSELLDLASELTPKFSIQIVDDGSTDSTFEIAEELAVHYPQITVQRHQHRRGLGPIIDSAQRRFRSEVVIVHDGVSRLDSGQIRRLWRERVAREAGSDQTTMSLGELIMIRHDQTAMADAHGRLIGGQNQSAHFPTPLPSPPDRAPTKPTKPPAPRDDENRRDLGRIPTLPRPSLLSALLTFAKAE